jgi:hypothetical protein
LSNRSRPLDQSPRAKLRRGWSESKKKWRQWSTRARFFLAYTLTGTPQPRVIFLHIPKTAGLSTARYILRRVGWRRTGRSADLAEMPWEIPVPAEKITLANRALFVFGHMSFDLIDQLDDSRKNYIFTFMREPKARLWSLYKHLNTYLEKFPLQTVHRSYPLIDRCSRLSAEEFFLTADPEILTLIDNHTVRQLAGGMNDYPVAEADWPELLAKAKANLRRVDFIGFQESYDADFLALMKTIKLALPKVVPHVNKALGGVAPRPAPRADVEQAIARYTKWDDALYRFAVELRASR